MAEEDGIIREALESGTDLRQYSQSIEKELRQLENLSIQDYIKKAQNIAELHHEITDCDSILKNMQEMLEGYLNHLSSISQEIQSLQEESASLNNQLTNRRVVHDELSSFITELMIPEVMIHHVVNTGVTEKHFMEQLVELDKKSQFLRSQQFRDARSCQDVQDIIDKLTVKAVDKIRDYLVQKIMQFKKPLSNYQSPQNAMIKHKFFFEFLLIHARGIATEIHDEYVETMSKIHASYFQAYTKQLWKLQYEEGVTKNDLMGVEEVKGGLLGRNFKSRGTVFTLGTRDVILSTDGITQDIIVPHTAQKDGTKLSFEVLFRSQQYALMDSGCREYAFITEFFMVKEVDGIKLFNTVFGKSLQHVQKEVCGVVMGCYDSIALLICIHLISQFRLLCHKRAVLCLDQHWDQLLKMILPRFEYVLQLNIQSIRDCDPAKMSNINTNPHYITRRYAEFSGAVAALQAKFPACEGADHLMLELQEEVEQVILKMAAVFMQRKEQLIFLINNYDMIYTVLSEKTREDGCECEHLKELLALRSAEYVQEVLAPYFGGILSFVRETEPVVHSGDLSSLSSYELKVVPLAKNFNGTWKESMQKLNNEVMQCFSNFRTGTLVLQRVLESLISAHQSFNRILSQSQFSHLNLKSDIVNSHHVIVEAKKYKPTF